jgi:uncharacterized protein YndB with AHSA1/START domain
METANKTSITVGTEINAPVEKVWRLWNEPSHITRWCSATPEWHTPRAENDLRPGGKFCSRMEARDGSMGFDFGGTYDAVDHHKKIAYTMDDGRRTEVQFISKGRNRTEVKETFDAESQNPVDMQRAGWQAILDNFKKYTEDAHLHYEITIDAPARKVYDTMLADTTYRKWTAAFNPTSHFKGNWMKGEKMWFIGTDENGGTGGMVSLVRENQPAKHISVEHIGILKNDEEILTGKEVDDWKGAFENYTFVEEHGKTTVYVDMDSNAEFKSYFEETWPKALQNLKAICETASN